MATAIPMEIKSLWNTAIQTISGRGLGRTVLILFVAIWPAIGMAGCSGNEPQLQTDKEGPTLLVFCGITMISPVRELAGLFQQAHGITVEISYGGSADLMQSFLLNKTGDIYFPGDGSFIDEAKGKGIILEAEQVGVNQAVLMVRKGNPKGLTGDLEELTRSDLQLAIGHPDLGSIGKEARRILQAQGLYEGAVKAAAMLKPDSRELTRVLLDDKVDVVINWKAVLSIDDNATALDVIPIQGDAAPAHGLVMAVTSYSAYPEQAAEFLHLCSSERGRAVFARYGF